MAPKILSVETDADLPARADVVIVGGGIIGLTTAMHLAEAGISCVVCEKGVLAGEQSSRNAGWVRQQGRDVREVELSIKSLAAWNTLDTRISGDTGFRQCGSVYAFKQESEMAPYQAWIARARECGLDTRIIGRQEIAALAPGFEQTYPVGLYTPSDGRAEPQRAAPMIARHARSLGVKVLDHCAVEGVETSAGAVSAVVTEKGRVATSTVVIAAGAWSSILARSLGIRLPQLKARVSMAKSDAVHEGPDAALWVPGLCIRRCDDGRYSVEQGGQYIADIVPDNLRFFREFLPSLFEQRREVKLRIGQRFFRELGYENWWKKAGASPFAQERTLDPIPSQAIVAGVKVMMNRHLTALGTAGVSETWGGYADVTPDAIPVISRVAGKTGVVISTGYSGHGFGLSQGAARLTADIVLEKPLPSEARHFDFARFSRS